MRPSGLIATIEARVKAHIGGTIIRPTNVVGSPGVGKTQIMAQAAGNLGIGFMCLHGPLMLAEDFGMPRFDADGELTFATPGHKFPFENTSCPDTGVMVIDELAQMDIPQQKIAANLFQERELHGRKIKPGWHFLATGNRQQDRAGANRILSHLNDRITTYELDVNHQDWAGWALTHGVRPEVVAFINFRPDLLNSFDPAHDKNPTPRSWSEGVSRAIDTVPPEAEFETYKGDVGEGPATEFVAFLRTFRELPDPDLILANPSKATIPSKPGILYALCGAIAHRATVDNFDRVMEFGEKLPPEFWVLLIRDCMRINMAVTTTAAYRKWASGAGKDFLIGN